MICSKCKMNKNEKCFRLNKNNKYDSWCKECHKKRTSEFKRTLKGLIGEIYNAQKANSKKRGHLPPEYSKKELESYLLNNAEYLKNYAKWIESEYVKDLRPSLDRINDYLTYSLNNIKVTTWKENKEKQYKDILNGTSTSGERCKKVIQKDKDGNTLNTFVSASEAARKTHGSQGHISACCRGERKTHNGFKWSYLNENRS